MGNIRPCGKLFKRPMQTFFGMGAKMHNWGNLLSFWVLPIDLAWDSMATMVR